MAISSDNYVYPSVYPGTVSCAFRTTQSTTTAVLIARADNTTSGNGFTLILNGSNLQMAAKQISYVINFTTSGVTVNDGNWHFVAIPMYANTSETVTVYIDGASRGSAVNSNAWGMGSGQVRLWRPEDPFWSTYVGDLAEVGIWSSTLTEAECIALSKGFAPPKVRPQLLVSYIPLVRNIIDVRGNTITRTGTQTPQSHPPVRY